ncbi:Copia protein [Termitomyces sp. J132]|nr:Copia protein [Termitomyces sp. J132]
MLHQHIKHVDIKYHFLREHIALKEIIIRYVNTKNNVADIFTKALPTPQFSKLHMILRMSVWDST